MVMKRPLCAKCKKCLATKSGGGKYFCKLCIGCMYEKKYGVRNPYQRSDKYKRPWAKLKKDFCADCGFTSEYPVQFDVDHIDGDRKNNEESNLQTLCSNCHRLKTFLAKEHMGLAYREKKR